MPRVNQHLWLFAGLLVAVAGAWWLWPQKPDPQPPIKLPEPVVQPSKPEVAPIAPPAAAAATAPASEPQRATRATLTAAQKQAWRQFGNVYKEKYSVVRHRSAVTGSLLDASAAAAQLRWCTYFSMPERFYDDNRIELSEPQRRLVRDGHEQCRNGALTVQKSIKQTDGYVGDPEQFVIASAGNGAVTPEAARQIFDFVKQTESASLLEAMPYNVLLKALYESGLLPPHPSLPKELDGGLLLSVLKLKGCEERGDCAGMGNFSPNCSQDNACVNDYREFAATRIYGDVSTRAHGYHPQLVGGATAAQLKERYEQIQRAVTTFFF
jgi:hypothetical protein